MENIATAARRCHVLATLPLCATAYGYAKSDVKLINPWDPLGAAVLPLGRHFIAVRLAENTGPASAARLAMLLEDIVDGPYREQFVVMENFTLEQRVTYQAALHRRATRRVTVGTAGEFSAWLPARLGALRLTARTSTVRRLFEDLLWADVATAPGQKDAFTCQYGPSKIKEDFDFGQLGVQCVGTLFSHFKGPARVANMEGNSEAQGSGFDLKVAESLSKTPNLKVEVKTESYPSGKITLELNSCYKAKKGADYFAPTPGWLGKSKADVLMSKIWPTGDVLAMDLVQVKEWVAKNPRELEPQLGGNYSQQDYYSLILLAKMSDLLDDLPDIVHFRSSDWLPELYQFEKPSLIAAGHRRTLQPWRPG